MTTGATGQLGLALPVQGELSGTWGDTVNNGITQYTNIAIAGTLTLTGDGAVTLANTTGDASASNITSSLTGAGTVTAQFAIVKISGTLTTTKVVTGPSYSKTYTVVNSATGGTVTFKASGQTGVSVAVGETAFVYFNGTDYVKVVGTATAGAAGGSNTQVQYNSSGVLAGSANLTFNGTTLTANTLNLTNALGIAYGGTGQITANAAFNALAPSQTGNSGKYLTTNGTDTSWATNPLGTVTSVDVSGGTTGLTTSGGPITTSGTITLAGTLATTNGGTGLTSLTAGYIPYGNGTSAFSSSSALTFNGTTLRVNAANSAYIGLINGTTKGVRFGADTTGGYVEGVDNTGSASYQPLIVGGSDLRFQTSGTEGMRLTSTGLGIGTSSPSAKLDVRGIGSFAQTSAGSAVQVANFQNLATDTNSAVELVFNNSTAFNANQYTKIGFARVNSPFGGDVDMYINLQSNGVTQQRLYLTSAGNLGIGTSSPSYRLDVSSASTPVARFTGASNAYVDFTDGTVTSRLQNSGALLFGTTSNHALSLRTNSTTQVTIDTSGNVGIGTSSPDGVLTIPATNSNTPRFRFQHPTNDADASIDTYQDGGGTYLSIGTNSYQTNAGSLSKFDATKAAGLAYFDNSGAILFYNATSGGSITEKMRLDSAGNLGLGVTPSAWGGGIKYAMEFLNGNSISSYASSNIPAFYFASNAYHDGTNWIRKTANPARLFTIDAYNGNFQWGIAGSSTAGSAITFTQAMTLDASGNLGVGTTSPSYKLDVNGQARISTGLTLTAATSSLYTTDGTLSRYSTTNATYLNGNDAGWLSLQASGLQKTYINMYGSTEANTPNIINIVTNSTERLRIASNGAWGLAGANYGTSGQVLTSAGSGAAPTWSTPGGGGGSWVYLSTVTASNSATVDIETTFDSTYDVYAIVVNSLVTAAETDIRVRIKISGAYSTSSIYDWISDRAGTNSPNATNSVNTAASFIKLTSDDQTYNGSPVSSNFVMYVYNPASTSLYKFFSANGQTTSLGDDKQVTRINHCSNCTSTAALTGVRFYLGSGNIVSGSFRLYGIKKS